MITYNFSNLGCGTPFRGEVICVQKGIDRVTVFLVDVGEVSDDAKFTWLPGLLNETQRTGDEVATKFLFDLCFGEGTRHTAERVLFRKVFANDVGMLKSRFVIRWCVCAGERRYVADREAVAKVKDELGIFIIQVKATQILFVRISIIRCDDAIYDSFNTSERLRGGRCFRKPSMRE